VTIIDWVLAAQITRLMAAGGGYGFLARAQCAGISRIRPLPASRSTRAIGQKHLMKRALSTNRFWAIPIVFILVWGLLQVDLMLLEKAVEDLAAGYMTVCTRPPPCAPGTPFCPR
jgi:hypothetical protein